MSKRKIFGHILMAIPTFLMLIVAIVSFYIYYTKSYPLTISTPITFVVIVALWILGLILIKDGKKENSY